MEKFLTLLFLLIVNSQSIDIDLDISRTTQEEVVAEKRIVEGRKCVIFYPRDGYTVVRVRHGTTNIWEGPEPDKSLNAVAMYNTGNPRVELEFQYGSDLERIPFYYEGDQLSLDGEVMSEDDETETYELEIESDDDQPDKKDEKSKDKSPQKIPYSEIRLYQNVGRQLVLLPDHTFTKEISYAGTSYFLHEATFCTAIMADGETVWRHKRGEPPKYIICSRAGVFTIMFKTKKLVISKRDGRWIKEKTKIYHSGSEGEEPERIEAEIESDEDDDKGEKREKGPRKKDKKKKPDKGKKGKKKKKWFKSKFPKKKQLPNINLYTLVGENNVELLENVGYAVEYTDEEVKYMINDEVSCTMVKINGEVVWKYKSGCYPQSILYSIESSLFTLNLGTKILSISKRDGVWVSSKTKRKSDGSIPIDNKSEDLVVIEEVQDFEIIEAESDSSDSESESEENKDEKDDDDNEDNGDQGDKDKDDKKDDTDPSGNSGDSKDKQSDDKDGGDREGGHDEDVEKKDDDDKHDQDKDLEKDIKSRYLVAWEVTPGDSDAKVGADKDAKPEDSHEKDVKDQQSPKSPESSPLVDPHKSRSPYLSPQTEIEELWSSNEDEVGEGIIEGNESDSSEDSELDSSSYDGNEISDKESDGEKGRPEDKADQEPDKPVEQSSRKIFSKAEGKTSDGLKDKDTRTRKSLRGVSRRPKGKEGKTSVDPNKMPQVVLIQYTSDSESDSDKDNTKTKKKERKCYARWEGKTEDNEDTKDNKEKSDS